MKRAILLIFGLCAAALLVSRGGLGSVTSTASVASPPAAKEIYFRCPLLVKAGAKNLPDGWNAVADKSYNFVEVGVLTPAGPIVCLYGRSGADQHSIMRLAPENHTCRAENARNRDVVCTPKPKAPIKTR